QPFDVVARRAQHCVQPVAVFALQVTAVHPVICLQVSDDRLDGLAALELPSFLCRQALGLAPVHYAYTRIVGIDAPDREGDDRNFHVHMLATTRTIGADGTLGAKAVIELANKD